MLFSNCVKLILICTWVLLVHAEDEYKSLSEAIDVGTSKKFEKTFEAKGANLLHMLELFLEKTNIKESYITKVFLDAANVNTVEDLESIHVDSHASVDFVNKVIKHFQKHPNAGQKEASSIIVENNEAEIHVGSDQIYPADPIREEL